MNNILYLDTTVVPQADPYYCWGNHNFPVAHDASRGMCLMPDWVEAYSVPNGVRLHEAIATLREAGHYLLTATYLTPFTHGLIRVRGQEFGVTGGMMCFPGTIYQPHNFGADKSRRRSAGKFCRAYDMTGYQEDWHESVASLDANVADYDRGDYVILYLPSDPSV